MRAIGLDVHRDWCDVAIYEDGKVRSAGRVATTPDQLALFAQSLAPDDRVALETTGNALSIARIIEPHVAGVLIADTRNVRAMTHAKVKNDRVDAQLLAKLLAAGMLPGTWVCDEQTRILRRQIARRSQLVRGRNPGAQPDSRDRDPQPQRARPGQRHVRQEGPRMARRSHAPRR